MTHGETYVHNRENINFRTDLVQIQKSICKLPPRMPRDEAIRYYGAKIKNYFRSKEDA